ncbi:MAG: hypothetical protein PUI46_00285 [Lachnospiraceae bacterium]|nr:hypothetical protein [Lachnospiraceae bacterium]MDY5699809.1 hypothetical protein [Lachnospiraceae bacterium]
MDTRPPLPFFMTYPEFMQNASSTGKLDDRDYMRQLYPLEIRQYLAVIVRVLDQIDFRENYIYDEYPDQVTLLRLTETILRLIPDTNHISREAQRNLLQLLLCDEILRRRENHNNF